MTGQWAAGWATGDVTFASEYKKGIGAIFDSTLGAPAANVDITSIVATYAHLLVVVYARSDAVVTQTGSQVRFNNDSAANYDVQNMQGQTATASASEGFAQTQGSMCDIPAASAGVNLFGAALLFIPHYAGSANNKACVSAGSMKSGTVTTSMRNMLIGSFWRSSAAINRITLLPQSGNFVAGTRVSLYGMGA